jgi:hypothetical protein
LLSEAYATDLQGSDLARYWRSSRGSAGELIFENGNGRLVDVGERVLARDGNDVEIRGLLDVVRAKGWETVEFTGEDALKWRAMEAAIRRGISVHADGVDQRLLVDAEAGFAEERRLATPAKVGIGNRYIGPIEAIFGDVVLRVEGGELVAHDRASFGEERADDLELAIGKEMAISRGSVGRRSIRRLGSEYGIEL